MNPSPIARKRLYLVLSMLIFGSIGYVRRMIPLPSFTLAFARGILGCAFLLAICRLTGRPVLRGLPRKKLALLIFSGCLIGLNWMLLFEAYNYTTIATATLCYYMQPTFVILLSPVLFHEKLTLRRQICALIALIGMVLVSGVAEGGFSNNLTGVLCGLGAATLYAGVIILNKFLNGVDAYSKTIVQLGAASVVMLPQLILTGSLTSFSLGSDAAVALAVAGIVHTGIAYALYFDGMDGLPAQSIAVISYVDPVFSLMISAFLLHEPMSVYGMLGAVMILGSALASEIRR